MWGAMTTIPMRLERLAQAADNLLALGPRGRRAAAKGTARRKIKSHAVGQGCAPPSLSVRANTLIRRRLTTEATYSL